MTKYCNRIRLATYVKQKTFECIEAERQKTKKTKSGIIADILDAHFAGDYNVNVQA